jgi:5-methylcytosine-specific restriction endonuclease McrA
MSERVGAALRRAVIQRADSCCEYCGMPDDVLRLPHEPDHIIPTQHGGQTVLENLAYTCFRCNRFKGPNLASIDPQSGAI